MDSTQGGAPAQPPQGSQPEGSGVGGQPPEMVAGQPLAGDGGESNGQPRDEGDDVIAIIRRRDIGSAAAGRVRLDFNVSGSERVNAIKAVSAFLITQCHGEKGEGARCAAIAATHYETAAMYAVKAATA